MGPVPSADVQLPHLETFSKAAELSSLTGAAKALRLSQAAISQRIHALEAALGKPVFQRRGGRVVLTETGKQLYDYAQRILDLHREARRVIGGQKTPVGGELLLAASSVPGEHLLPALLSDFSKKYPYIRVHATVTDSAAVLTQLQRGEVSLGLVGRKDPGANLEYHRFASDRIVLVVPASHPLSCRAEVPLRELADYPLVLREVGSGLRHCFEKSLERTGRSLSDLRVVLELGSNEAIKDAVLRGVGVAVLSSFAIQKELKAGQLHALGVRGLRCNRDIYIVRERTRVLPLPARIFLDFLETNPLAGQKS